MTELTPFTEEADNLWWRVVETRWDADEAEKAFEGLSVRLRKDNDELLGSGRSRMSLSRRTLRLGNGSLTFWPRLRRKGN